MSDEERAVEAGSHHMSSMCTRLDTSLEICPPLAPERRAPLHPANSGSLKLFILCGVYMRGPGRPGARVCKRTAVGSGFQGSQIQATRTELSPWSLNSGAHQGTWV